jgi:hypothetical protein
MQGTELRLSGKTDFGSLMRHILAQLMQPAVILPCKIREIEGFSQKIHHGFDAFYLAMGLT